MVNSGQASVSLNGVSLGGLGFDGCSSELRTASIVAGVHAGTLMMDDVDPDKVVAWLARNTEENLEVADVTKG